MSVLSELRQLRREAREPGKVTDDMKRDPMFVKGYALGYRHALEEAIEIVEEGEE